jgi:hypothetical protein
VVFVSDDDSPLPLTSAEEVFKAAFGVVFVGAMGNWLFDLHLFKPHDGRVAGATMFAGLIFMRYAQARYASPVAFTARQNGRYLLLGALAAAWFVIATMLTPLLP